jgi:hypothetical protein
VTACGQQAALDASPPTAASGKSSSMFPVVGTRSRAHFAPPCFSNLPERSLAPALPHSRRAPQREPVRGWEAPPAAARAAATARVRTGSGAMLVCFRSPRVLRDAHSDSDEEEDGEEEAPSSSGRGGGALHGGGALRPGVAPAARTIMGSSLSPAGGARTSSPRASASRALPGRAVRVSGGGGGGGAARALAPSPPPGARTSGGLGLSRAPSLDRERSTPARGVGAKRGAAAAAAAAAAAPATPPQSPRRDANGRCDRCDGDHDTDDCPAYPRARDAHPDATRRRPIDMGGSGGNLLVRSGRVIRQPGDGSCLFHSLAHGLGPSCGGAATLRRELAEWVARNGDARIADTPLSDWVQWDSGESPGAYARRLARAGWGGGIELAACARLKRVNVHVYERRGSAFKRISCFDVPGGGAAGGGGGSRGGARSAVDAQPPARTLHVLYCGGVHYDALEPELEWTQRL